jgi:hypothetical protein
MGNAYKVCIRNPEWKKPLERPRHQTGNVIPLFAICPVHIAAQAVALPTYVVF